MAKDKENDNGALDDAIDSLTDALMSKWKSESLLGNRKIASGHVKSGLNTLIEKGLLKTAAVTMGGEAGLMLADAAIKLFQSEARISVDGVLGSETFKALFDVGVQQDVHDNASDAPAVPSPQSFNPTSPLLFYYVEGDLQTDMIGSKRAVKLINESQHSWVVDTNLFLVETLNRDEANFIIKWEVLPGNVTGRAHIGGPRFINQQLSLRIDKDRHWDETRFLNTFGHELGHILGLEQHDPDPKYIMYGGQTSVVEPGDRDKSRLRDVWRVA